MGEEYAFVKQGEAFFAGKTQEKGGRCFLIKAALA